MFLILYPNITYRDETMAARTAVLAKSGVASPAAHAHAAAFRRLQHRAAHATVIANAVARLDAAVFPATARLAARWVGAHLLSNHIRPEAVELLAVAAFWGPSTLPVPGMS
jgi:hypothetical protein